MNGKFTKKLVSERPQSFLPLSPTKPSVVGTQQKYRPIDLLMEDVDVLLVKWVKSNPKTPSLDGGEGINTVTTIDLLCRTCRLSGLEKSPNATTGATSSPLFAANRTSTGKGPMLRDPSGPHSLVL